MTDDKKKRPAPISYRPLPGREEEIYARAAAEDQSVNAFLNTCVFGKRAPSRAERKQLALLLHQAARISDQLNETALTGAAESTLTIEAAHRELTEIRAALLILMGRKP